MAGTGLSCLPWQTHHGWGLEGQGFLTLLPLSHQSGGNIASLWSSEGVTQRESPVSGWSGEKSTLLVAEPGSKIGTGDPVMCVWVGGDCCWERRG